MPRIDPIPELKQQVAATLVRLLEPWRSLDAAALIGTQQPRIYDIRRGKLDRFSLETLIRYVSRLHHRVELQITKAPPALKHRLE